MNNLKKAGVMVLIFAMTLTVVLVPFTPMNQIQPVAKPDYATPEEVLMDIQKYIDTQKEGGPLGSILASYRDTGYIPNSVARNDAGDMGVLVTVRSDSDVASLDEIIDVNWKVEIGAMTLASGFVSSPEAVVAIENFDGIVTAFADALKRDATTGVEPRPDIAPENPTEPDSYAILPEIGADLVHGLGITGAGVSVGVIDTGTDFSVEGLVGTMDIGSDGLPTSFDPTGYGFGCLLYRANATVVNATAWLEYSSWNVLSYMKDGKYYLNWSSFNEFYEDTNYVNGNGPRVNNQGGLVNLDWWYDGYLGAWWPGTSPGTTYPGNVTAMTEFYYDVMRQDPELPAPSTTMGSPTLPIDGGTHYYTAGYVMQQRNDPYMKIFAPAIVLNGSKVVVDWNTTRAHTDFWNLNINWGEYDFGDPAVRTRYENMGDWSFVDDLEAGLYYTPDGTEEHLNMYYDYPSDGVRFGLGTLAHCWEYNIFGLAMIDGIGLSGRAVGIMYDGDSHGTFVSSEIAGQPVSYPVGLNGTSETLQGIAPDAKIMGVMTVGIASEFMSMLWAAGFDVNYTSGYFEWNWDSAHQTQITSNSWGWVTGQNDELAGQYSLIYVALATPGFFNASYPGQVICFSAGNSGPGYATTTPPRGAQLINVGASTSYHTFENSYGPDQGFDQIADFSSRGPLFLGYPKPDVLAPGRNNYGLVPTYGGAFGITAGTPYAVYAGTSMACPLAAGLAALMLDAAPGPMSPDMVKTIMQNTADDIGMDGLSQGHGVINAFAAVDFILNGNGVNFYTYDSVDNWAESYQYGWSTYMNPYDGDAFINTTYPPVGFADGNLYFGEILPSATNTLKVEGNSWIYADQTFTAMHYVEDTVTTFPFETYVFNETTSLGHDSLRGGWFELETLLAGNYANFQDAPYATISITGAQSTFAVTGDPLWAFVFNWDDTDVPNSRVDYYNTSTGLGDELTRLQYGGGTGNVLKMDLSHPDGLGNLFPAPGIPIVLVNDNTIFSSWHTTGDGNALEVTVTTWKLVPDTNVGFAANGDDCDVTLTAPAEYGIHQGFVVVNGTHKLPYSYLVQAKYDTAGTVMKIAEGYGVVRTPYENGAITAGYDSYYTSRSADHLAFVVRLNDTSVNYWCARLNWTNPDTDMDVAIISHSGYQTASSADSVKTTDTSALAISDTFGFNWDDGEDHTSPWVIYVSVNDVGGSVPENFTLSVIGLATIDEPTLQLSWTSKDSLTPTLIADGGSAVGDHVVMKATWTDGTNVQIPEFEIANIKMSVLYGTLFYADNPKAVCTDNGQFGAVIDPSQFAWETVPGINLGDVVRISCDFDGSDVDVMAWWSDTPVGERGYGNNILGGDMASAAKPEATTITTTRGGDIEFGILDYAQDGGHYYLTVDNRVGIEEPVTAAKEYSIDTYQLLANATYGVLVESRTGANIRYTMSSNVFIGNFFAPKVTVNSAVSLGSNLYNFTWSASDLNEDDSQFYSVSVSSDAGISYQLVAQNLTETFFVWSAAGWFEGDYYYRVRVYSFDTVFLVDGEPLGTLDNPPSSYGPYSLYADDATGPFAAGDVPVPTEPTTTTTTTTTTTPTEQPAFDPLLIGLIGGIGVGVVVLLILFLIRKK